MDRFGIGVGCVWDVVKKCFSRVMDVFRMCVARVWNVFWMCFGQTLSISTPPHAMLLFIWFLSFLDIFYLYYDLRCHLGGGDL